MPQGVPVGGRLWVVVAVEWEYNDNYYYPEGNGDCCAAYTTRKLAEAEARERSHSHWMELTDPRRLMEHTEGGLADYSTLPDEERIARLGALGIVENEPRWEIEIDPAQVWGDAELDELAAILSEIQFYEVQEITLEE